MPYNERFEIDVSNFWKPIKLEEQYVEKDMNAERFKKKVGQI
jgi:hypothetical protein